MNWYTVYISCVKTHTEANPEELREVVGAKLYKTHTLAQDEREARRKAYTKAFDAGLSTAFNPITAISVHPGRV